MLEAAGIVAALGVLGRFAVKRHARTRDTRRRELLGAQALYAEMDAALRSVELAAREAGSRWADGLCESKTLMEAWIAHGPQFQTLDPVRWEILDRAVRAVAPSYDFPSASPPSDDLEPSLAERQERLTCGIDVLRELLSTGALGPPMML